MKKIAIISSILFLAFACESNKTDKTVREGKPDIYNVEKDDKEMNEAISKAKTTLSEFKEAFLSNKFDSSSFSLKMKFFNGDGAEHIWMSDIEIENGDYYGLVGNEPNTIDRIQLGDRLKIPEDSISDWMYIDNKKILKGGYTIRLLRDRMTKKEQRDFEKDLPFIIKD